MAPSDTQQTDTYYIVAHFHYVLFGGAILGIFAGLYYWWPKVFGYKLDERWGKTSFWIQLIGFNMTFGPMHILGLQGMPRRMATYDDAMGFDLWNFVATIGSFTENFHGDTGAPLYATEFASWNVLCDISTLVGESIG